MVTGNNLPQVLPVEGRAVGDRGFKTAIMANSSKQFAGSFFDPRTGTNGAQSFAANQPVRGIVVDIETYYNGSYISVFYLGSQGVTVPGTLTIPTATVQGDYTTSSANVSKDFPDRVVYMEINNNDEIEATLANSSGVPVPRGTTAASAVRNNYLEPLAASPWLLDEAGANASATGLNFQIVDFPQDPNKVIIKLINANGAVS